MFNPSLTGTALLEGVMLHRKYSSTTVRKNSFCHPASAFVGEAESAPRLWRETHQHTAAGEAYEGADTAGTGQERGQAGILH